MNSYNTELQNFKLKLELRCQTCSLRYAGVSYILLIKMRSRRCRHCPPSHWVVHLVLCHHLYHSVFYSERIHNHAVVHSAYSGPSSPPLKAGFTQAYSSYPFASASFMRSIFFMISAAICRIQ